MTNALSINDADFNALRLHMQLLDQVPGLMCGFKDTDSRFILANQYSLDLFGYSSMDNLRGLKDSALHCPAAEFADIFRQQDLYVMNNRKTIEILQVFTYADGKQRLSLVHKAPFWFKGKMTGCFCQSVDTTSHALCDMASTLQQADRRYFGKRASDRSYTLGDTPGRNTLTDRELDCLFHMLRGKTMKEIGTTLRISWRTVESYLASIKSKWGCSNKGMVIDYAVERGFLNYIPPHMLKQDFSQIIHIEGSQGDPS